MNRVYGYAYNIKLSAKQFIPDKIFSLHSDKDFIVEKVIAYFDHPFKVKISDTKTTYEWFHSYCHSNLFFGTAEYPNILQYPIELGRSTNLKMSFINLADEDNNIQIYFEGYKVDIKNFSKKIYFSYPFDYELQPYASKTEHIVLENSADFLLTRLIGHFENNAYDVNVLIRFSGIGDTDFANISLKLGNLFGTVLKPNILNHPIRLRKNSIITMDLKNEANEVRKGSLLFEGVKLYE